jgi:hypothetical protein
MSLTSSTKKARQRDALIDILRRKQAALRHRQGNWQILTRDGAGQTPLPGASQERIKRLIAEGLLVCGEDGLFRPAAQALRPMTDSDESPLAALLRNKGQYPLQQFDNEHLKAAERLRRDYEKAHWSPRVTVNYAPAEGASSRHWQVSDNALERLSEKALHAREMVHAALDAVGPELSGMLLHVCCLISGLEEAERLLCLPRRSGRVLLALGLSRLARHYGYKPQLRHSGPQRIGHWAVSDFRPDIMPTVPPGHLP